MVFVCPRSEYFKTTMSRQSVSDRIELLRIWALPLLVVILAAPPALAHTGTRKTPGRTATGKSAAANFDALSKSADAAREANRLEEASALYLQALRLKPAWKEGWWYVGAMFYERDRHAEAREAFLKFVAVDPKFGPALAMLGLCEFQLRQYEPALIH